MAWEKLSYLGFLGIDRMTLSPGPIVCETVLDSKTLYYSCHVRVDRLLLLRGGRADVEISHHRSGGKVTDSGHAPSYPAASEGQRMTDVWVLAVVL